MILDLPGAALRRAPGETDFADLTSSRLTGEPSWLDEDRLNLPFKPEPTAIEQARIRRRLLTVDAAQEAWVGKMVASYRALATDKTAVAVALRLLIEDRLGSLNE